MPKRISFFGFFAGAEFAGVLRIPKEYLGKPDLDSPNQADYAGFPAYYHSAVDISGRLCCRLDMEGRMEATKATKYKRVKFSPARIVKLYKAGKSVSQIAQAIGYPPNTGQNRVRGLLITAGLYKAVR
jgi:hypothetical protein